MQINENLSLKELVEPENDLKNMLVEYVGKELNPEDSNVTVEMIVEVMATQFPEFLLAIAEENWVRGYQQACDDGAAIHQDKIQQINEKLQIIENETKKTKSCKLCKE
tara:strand:- start:27150 stop:27473 length:324 start_codon:yes stop_codon:yes gene_type:complete